MNAAARLTRIVSRAMAKHPNGGRNDSSGYSVTALGRWSILNKQPPAVESIKAIYVYDFDNTLFKTPLPNPKLWNGPTIGALSNPNLFINGGWWHDSRILAATGEGLAKEEPRGWEGWWNDKVAELVGLSNQQRDALCILLTGRSETGFSELIKRMVASKGLAFDMIALKPAVGPDNQRFVSTMNFKQAFLEAVMETYRQAEEIRIYEDRPKHVKAFRDFLFDYNKKQGGIGGRPTRGPIHAEVVQVAELATNLDPVVEVAEVQHLMNAHNEAVATGAGGKTQAGGRMVIKKTVFYTGYLIDAADTQRLLSLAQIPPAMRDVELKYHANNIMICPRPCPDGVLDKAGGMGSKMTWQVTGVACFENSIWAACLKPVPPTAKFHSDNPVPLVILALRKGARAADAAKIHNWQSVPADKAFVFETTVGEKVLLRIEPEDAGGDQRGSNKRKHGGDAEFRARQPGAGWNSGSYRNDSRNYHQQSGRGGGQSYGRGRGGAGRGYRGQRGGAARGGRGRGGGGGNYHYRSLDDVGTRESQGSFSQQVTYEDDADRRYYQNAQPPAQDPYHYPQPQYQPPYQQQYSRPSESQGGRPGGRGGYQGGELQNLY